MISQNLVICVFICLLCLDVTGSVISSDPGNSDVTSIDDTCIVPMNISLLSLDDYVNSATEYARCAGKEAAVELFNDPSGPFTYDDLYIFACSADGITIAHPFDRELLNANWMNLTDDNGVGIKKTEISLAQQGGGRFYYMWNIPGQNETPHLKLSQIEPVNDDWYIGGGIYLLNQTAKFTDEDRNKLVSFVTQARDYAQEYGFDAATAEFSNLQGDFIDGQLYIYAYDRNGVTVAHPFQPELIGTDRIGFADTNGVELIRNLRDVAFDWGGGFTYFMYVNPNENNMMELKLGYVLPVDENWFVGSGIYQNQTDLN